MIKVGDVIQVGSSTYALGRVIEIYPRGYNSRNYKSLKCEWARDGDFGKFSLVKEFKVSDCKKVKNNG